jgi:hypothetical protein
MIAGKTLLGCWVGCHGLDELVWIWMTGDLLYNGHPYASLAARRSPASTTTFDVVEIAGSTPKPANSSHGHSGGLRHQLREIDPLQ